MAQPEGMDQAAKDAFDAASKLIAEKVRAGETGISFATAPYRALTHIPDEIAGIKGLTRIDLNNTKISDLSVLAGLTGLQILRLSKTGVSDLSALAGLTGLQRLSLDQTGVSDLSALAGLTGLQRLFLSQTGVSDLSALAGLTGLEWLYLDQTGVSDLSALAGLTGLQGLYLSRTGVSDLRPLVGLEELGDGPVGGLWFAGTPAVRLDDTLARLAGIEDDEQRTKEVLAYLKTLPPLPEPLPWLDRKSPAKAPLVPSPVPGRGLVPPVGLRRISMKDAQELLSKGHPILRDRCQRVVAEIDDAIAMLSVRIPNDPDQLTEHEFLMRTLVLSKTALEGIHNAIPADLTDQPIDGVAAGRLRLAFDTMLQSLKDAAAYIDRKDHSPTYGGLLKIGAATSVATVAAIAPGVAFATALPVVFACLYGPEAAKSLLDIKKLGGG